jgi:UDP-glucose 4-epimerase
MPIKTQSIDSAIAVVGAAGFLGRHTVQHLRTMTKDLRCVSRRLPMDSETSGLHWFKSTLSNFDTLKPAIKGCNTVIHLAGSSTPASANKNMAADVGESIQDSLRLFDACVDAKVSRIIFISSGGTVYGEPKTIPTPEDEVPNPISAYGLAKLTVERYLELYKRQYGLDYKILRVANAYGPLQNAEKKQGVITAFIEQALNGQPLEIWGDGNNIRDYVYVEDVVDAIERSVRYQKKEHIFNIGSGNGLSLLQIVEMIGQILGKKLVCHHREAMLHDVPVNILDCSRAKTELGWVSRADFMEKLRQNIEWLQQNRKTNQAYSNKVARAGS